MRHDARLQSDACVPSPWSELTLTGAPRRLVGVAVGLGLSAGLLAACVPLPIPHTERKTPYITGTIQREDGSPAAGRTIGVREPGMLQSPPSCRAPRARTTTDSLGRFVLPSTSAHVRIFWFTLFERFDLTWFATCELAGDRTGGTPVATSDVITGSTWGTALTCLEWSWRDSLRLTCDADRLPRDRHMWVGGTWSDSTGHGVYRVIIRDVLGCHGGLLARVGGVRGFVQWLAGGEGALRPVRRTEELKGDRRCLPYGRVSLDRIGDATVVRLSPDNASGDLVWELGAPGAVFLRQPAKR